jgi:plasmid stabilization system protein ParE
VTYRVVWDNRALEELRQIRQNYVDREGLRNTVTRIDTQLAYQPNAAGESRHGNYRVLFKYPLVVWFEVLDQLREVQVVHVRRTKR